MSGADFFDTNVLLYLFSYDEAKAQRAEDLIAQGGVISVQVLNEFSSVAVRKMKFDIADIGGLLAPIRKACRVEALTLETHETGLALATRYSLSLYDAMIAASALGAGCSTLWSEDMQDGLLIEQRLRVRNPF